MGAKTLDTLVEDIYDVFREGVTIPEEAVDDLGRKIANVIKDRIESNGSDRPDPKLRLSAIGKCVRHQQLEHQIGRKEEPSPSNKIRFLYGDILEELLLFLAHLSGHEVTGEQEQLKVNGVVGHRDAVIDGVTVDVKSASPYAFKKFSEGLLFTEGNDPFGYVAQISAYTQARGDKVGAFLAINKNSGEIALLQVDEDKQIDSAKRVDFVREWVNSEEPAPREVPLKTDKSGNKVLHSNCSFCSYKHECWADANDGKGLLVLEYANGASYIVEKKEGFKPRVNHGFINEEK